MEYPTVALFTIATINLKNLPNVELQMSKIKIG